jgi:hypothetical protein
MCDAPPEETLEHMIFHCSFNRTCWQSVGMVWQDMGNRLQLIEQGKATWNKPLFMETFMLASWNIWKERNKMLFEGIAPSLTSWKARLRDDLNLLIYGTKGSVHQDIYKLFFLTPKTVRQQPHSKIL